MLKFVFLLGNPILIVKIKKKKNGKIKQKSDFTNKVSSDLPMVIQMEVEYSKVESLDNQKSHFNHYCHPWQDVLIINSQTVSVPPVCPLVDVLMSSEMVTEKTAGVSGKLIHK